MTHNAPRFQSSMRQFIDAAVARLLMAECSPHRRYTGAVIPPEMQLAEPTGLMRTIIRVSFVAERHHRIDLRRAASRNIGGGERNRNQHESDNEECQWVGRFYF